MQELMKKWWTEVLKREELPLDASLRNHDHVRDPRVGFTFWPKLVSRRALYLDFIRYSKLDDVPEIEFYVVLSDWLYVYGREAQQTRREVEIQRPGVRGFHSVRRQRYYTKVPLPVVLRAKFAHVAKVPFKDVLNEATRVAAINNERMKAMCLGLSGDTLTQQADCA